MYESMCCCLGIAGGRMEFDTGRASSDGMPVALAEPTRLENMPQFGFSNLGNLPRIQSLLSYAGLPTISKSTESVCRVAFRLWCVVFRVAPELGS
jgi:hypothetical protein